jgi:hypothetical protein
MIITPLSRYLVVFGWTINEDHSLTIASMTSRDRAVIALYSSIRALFFRTETGVGEQQFFAIQPASPQWLSSWVVTVTWNTISLVPELWWISKLLRGLRGNTSYELRHTFGNDLLLRNGAKWHARVDGIYMIRLSESWIHSDSDKVGNSLHIRNSIAQTAFEHIHSRIAVDSVQQSLNFGGVLRK